MDQPAHPSKLRQIRVVPLINAALLESARHAVPLFRISWLPCLLSAIALVALEWYLFKEAEQVPEWLLSNDFYPPSWAAPLIAAPFAAMVWMSVFKMKEAGGAFDVSRAGPLGLDWNQRIFLATIVLAILNLLIGGARNLERMFLVYGLPLIHGPTPPQEALEAWVGVTLVFHSAVTVLLTAYCFMLAGHVLRTGRFDLVRAWTMTDGNRLRILAVFLILGGARAGLVLLTDPGVGWLTDTFTDTSAWSLLESVIRHGTYWPVAILSAAISAIVVYMMLEVIEPSRG